MIKENWSAILGHIKTLLVRKNTFTFLSKSGIISKGRG